MLFRDRYDAGRQLALRLAGRARPGEGLVLALPRGGVPVGSEVAQALGVPIDVFVVRKLGVPGQEELAMGAIASGGVRVLNEELLATWAEAAAQLAEVTAREMAELARRETLYRDGRPAPKVAGKVVLLVDDGLATGSTMRAAVRALRQLGPARIIAAVPVGTASACALLQKEAGEAVCLRVPENFAAVGQFYEDFSPTEDEEVRALLARASRKRVSGDA